MQSSSRFNPGTLSRRTFAIAALAVSVSCGLAQRKEKIYLAPDDHTDYMWTGDEETYRKALLQSTDYYLDLADKTAKQPAALQSRWNFDSALWFWIYENNRTPNQVERLVGRLKDGHFSMPLTFAVSTYGGTPMEATLRGMYFAGRVERKYGLHLPMAIAMENQTLPRGLGALWAGAGAKYSWKGICGCATKLIPTVYQTRPHEIYWWKGTDDSRILMKWHSMRENVKSAADYNSGGYAEARDPSISSTIPFLDETDDFRRRYPYKVVGIFGEGEDNLFTNNEKFLTAAKQLTRPDREVIVSNEEDFFRDFEARYGKDLPTESAAYGNDWDLYPASMQEVSSSVRRATEKLRSAEAMETMVSLKLPDFAGSFTKEREKANTAFGLFWEHNWTADGKTISRQERADWERRVAHDITSYVDALATASNTSLGKLIARQGTEPRYFVFNSLSWTRDDVADLPYAGPENVHVVDLLDGATVPSQFVAAPDDTGVPTRRLRIFASGIPSVGYKVYAVRPGVVEGKSGELTAAGNVVESDLYRVVLTGSGAIESLQSKMLGKGEMVAKIDGRLLNDLGEGTGTVRVKEVGPVSATLRAESGGELPHSTEVTLYRGIDRVSIRNEILGNFSGVKTWAFSFNLEKPDVWHEEVGTINHVRLQPEGDYSPVMAKLDWLTLNHFISMSGDSAAGITLSSSDNSFFKLGHSDIVNGVTHLDTATPLISVLAGGQVDGPRLGIPAQGGDSHFLQRFALRTQAHPNAATSMRFSLEDQNPFVTGAVIGGQGYPETTYSLLQASDPSVMLWAIKPAEDGIAKGIVTRFWNMAPKSTRFTVKLQSGIRTASAVTHIETDPVAVPVSMGGLDAKVQAWQVRSFQLQPRILKEQSGPPQGWNTR